MGVSLVPALLPMLGLLGLARYVDRLFYIVGGLSAIGAIPFALSRAFPLLVPAVCVCLIVKCSYASAFWSGMTLCSCGVGLFTLLPFAIAMFKI